MKEKGMAQDFSAFFVSTCPGMLAKAILLSGHRQEAEDAVQEAYTEALRSWHRIGDYDSPEAWVYKVMRQRVWAAARRASRQVPSGVDLQVPSHSAPSFTPVNNFVPALSSQPAVPDPLATPLATPWTGISITPPPFPVISMPGPPLVTTIIVPPGDSLSALACGYQTTVKALQKLNHLGQSVVIYAGQRLKVPFTYGIAGIADTC
jgi:LysM repeat protein